MALPTYSTGTASVAAGGTVVTGAGCSWTGINVKQGDFISIGGSDAALITEVTDATHLKVSPWPDAAKTSQPYIIYQNYVGRVVGVAAAEDVGTMLEKLHTDGLPFIVDPGLTVPDPSYGDDGQFAFQPTTGNWWTKTGGVWVASPGLTSDSTKVLKTGDTMTGNLTISRSAGNDAALLLSKGASGTANVLYGLNNLVSRWTVALGDAIAETGSNLGSNFSINRLSDAGAYLGTPLYINRDTARGVYTGNFEVNGQLTARLPSYGITLQLMDSTTGWIKGLRVNPTGDLTVINSAATTEIMHLTDGGDLSWTGTPWTAYTPTVTVTQGAGTATGRYKRFGKALGIEAIISVTTGGSSVSFSLPAGMAAAGEFSLVGREAASTGYTVLATIAAGSTAFGIIRYDNVFTVVTGAVYRLNGMIEVQ